MAIQEQVKAYGGPKFQLTQQVMSRFAEAIESARVDVVPKILIAQSERGEGGGAQGGSGLGGSNLIEGLLAMMLSDKMGIELKSEDGPSSPAAEAYRAQLLKQIQSPVQE